VPGTRSQIRGLSPRKATALALALLLSLPQIKSVRIDDADLSLS